MLEFIVDNFPVFLAVILVAMIPTLESKIALPLGLSYAVWGEGTLSPFLSFLCAYVGSMIPCIIVLLIVRKIKNKTSGFVQDKFLSRMQEKYRKKLEVLGGKGKTFYKLSALCFFVAVPLPLTGVYTGSLIAGLSNLKIWQSFIAIAIGELISCLVIFLLCTIFENSVGYILLVSLILVAVFVLFDLIFMFIKKHGRKHKKVIEIHEDDVFKVDFE